MAELQRMRPAVVETSLRFRIHPSAQRVPAGQTAGPHRRAGVPPVSGASVMRLHVQELQPGQVRETRPSTAHAESGMSTSASQMAGSVCGPMMLLLGRTDIHHFVGAARAAFLRDA
jgi:hypothetical protein